MASPQKEHGYTAIANSIMEALARTPLDGGATRCLFYILRQTYGWGRKSATLSYGDIAAATQLPRRTVIRSMQSLVAKGIILPGDTHDTTPSDAHDTSDAHVTSTAPKSWTFNKNFDSWVGASDTHDTTPLVSPVSLPLVSPVSPATPSQARRRKASGEPKTRYKAIESENTSYSPPSAASDSEQAASPVEEKPLAKLLGTLPLNDGTDFEIRADLVAELQPLYPAIDVLAELKGMKGWLIGNPKNRKTRKGVMRFITSWLARSQDKAPRIAGSTRPHPNTGAGAPVTYAQKQDQAKRGLAAMVIAHDQETRSQAFADGIGQEGHFMPTPETNGNGLAGYVAGVAGGLRPHEQPALLGSHGQVPQDQPILPEYLGHHPSL